jgi:hypothetical protein
MSTATAYAEKDLELLMTAWSGNPTIIPSDGLQMAPSPNGSLILGFFNTDPGNNNGQVSVSSGGGFFQQFDAPAQQAAPVLFVHNFTGNNLNVSNTSVVPTTKLLAEAWAPGLQVSGSLPSDGKPYPLSVYSSRKAVTLPQRMMVTLAAGNGQYTVFAVYVGTDVSLYCVNAPDPTKVPPGYTKVTSDNSLQISGMWNGATLYVANLSTGSQTGATVSLKAL